MAKVIYDQKLTILVISFGGWGKGETYEIAYEKCRQAAGLKALKERHCVYCSTDPDIYVDEYGTVNYKAASQTTRLLFVIKGKIVPRP